ncbi:TIGR01777 family oxidoreductase [Alteromonas sp. ASW11-130]|uniref:TIGR01777 family oxidoreductase n=1 Tax=Alteromonas sp. ASW11-130 TaxID=3015775 RepID=UPI002241E5CF|nr:TIGR01777 family oxidoreductase [Alteromonas sp. ASW11-130]MCW8091391.1 TIGR01777 family oxidoreductase [Alteromonas sp. ASW11-130]
MHILITGGTGLIGRHLIKALVGKHDITVLTRNIERASTILKQNISFVQSLEELTDFSKFDAIINLAGEPIADKRWTERQKNKICKSRWQLTQKLVDKIKRASSPPEVFISGSAVGYYGRQGKHTVTEEQHQVHEEFTHTVCNEWEAIAEQAKSKITRVCTIRTGIVLAKGEGALGKMALPFKLGMGGKLGDGEQIMSWIHIDDEVAAILYLLTNENCEGPYNLTSPHPVSNAEFSKQLAHTLHRPNLFTVPAFVLKTMLGETSDLLLTGQRVLPSRLLSQGFEFKYQSLDSALDNLYG